MTQGEQVAILWGTMFRNYRIKIHFAHRTFKWSNEAKGNAAVYCVIIGFANYDMTDKKIFEYPTVVSEPHELSVKNINPYLVEGTDTVVPSRSKPLCNVNPIINGSKPVDGGNLIFNQIEKDEFVESEPTSEKYLRLFAGADDFINGKTRWCLWLKDITPTELKQLPKVMDRVQAVRDFRLKSPKDYTRRKADMPTLFEQVRQPTSDFLLIPRHSSENRRFMPIGFLDKNVIVADSATFIPNATLFMFGVMVSSMHMAWVKSVCGRIKSDFRYSNDIVYNNYPWPQALAEKQVKAVETAAQRVLDVRASFVGSTLADLYDPLTMPPALVIAHQDLDRAVDLCYRPQAFPSETRRIEYLFELYEQYTAPLMAAAGIEGKKKRKVTL